ncbi:MAG: KH domain-containing protein [Verrucomicrobia bacterium]|nr:KH domain-containing protein [Deltaproteobacteria bacterium]
MKALVETIAKALVDDPSQVMATEETEEDTLVIKLTVAKDDMGRIIGKEGRTAKAIRTILNAVSTKGNTKAVLKIVE